MDIKIKLEDEILFSTMSYSGPLLVNLNKNNIFTIEDFINCNIDTIEIPRLRKSRYRAFQHILRYKYLSEPLVLDVLLDKESIYYKEISDALRSLGFDVNMFSREITWTLDDKNGSCKVIDVIRYMKSKNNYLRNFYIEYYDTQEKKEQESYLTGENDKATLDELKNQLVSLLNRRNELDLQISSLLEQINTLEGGKVANGRK